MTTLPVLNLFPMLLMHFWFAREAKKRGFVFTLNQDLFVERFYSNASTRIIVPGLRDPRWFGGLQRANLERKYEIPLPDRIQIEQYCRDFWAKLADAFAYVKLHGSFGWRS